MSRIPNPSASLSALQDFQVRMNGLRDLSLDDEGLRRAIEKFTVKQWQDIASDLQHTVSAWLCDLDGYVSFNLLRLQLCTANQRGSTYDEPCLACVTQKISVDPWGCVITLTAQALMPLQLACLRPPEHFLNCCCCCCCCQGWTACEAQRHWECSCALPALQPWEEEELLRLR
jgi:hypothetical protein